MNKALFKANLKGNWLIAVIIMSVMYMYLAVMISMFDPESIEGLREMIKMLPKELVSAMGFEDLGTSLTTYLGNMYYNFIAIMFPMIYVIIASNRLVAKHVDSGSMAYLLSTPNSRLKIVATQAIYLISSVASIFLFLILAGIGTSHAMFPGELDTQGFILLNLVTLLAFLAISGIGFFFSCIFDDTKYALGFGAGVPIAFFVLNMLANAGDNISWVRFFTIFTLINPAEILAGSAFTPIAMLILLSIAALAYAGGIIVFNRRSLPL